MHLRRIKKNAEAILQNAIVNLDVVNKEISDRAIYMVNSHPVHAKNVILLDGKSTIKTKQLPHKKGSDAVEIWIDVWHNNSLVVGACKYIAIKDIPTDQQLVLIETIENRLKQKA